MANKYALFNIIKHAGEPQEGKLPDGRKVYRLKEITESKTDPITGSVKMMTIKCAPYDNHFIYRVPDDIYGPRYCCSCGSPAVIVGTKAYKHLSSLNEFLWVCMFHTNFNRHADGSS